MLKDLVCCLNAWRRKRVTSVALGGSMKKVGLLGPNKFGIGMACICWKVWFFLVAIGSMSQTLQGILKTIKKAWA